MRKTEAAILLGKSIALRGRPEGKARTIEADRQTVASLNLRTCYDSEEEYG